MNKAIVWFRKDLRLADNPALVEASVNAEIVIPLYILDQTEDFYATLGGASKWWLEKSLAALSQSLEERASYLILKSGSPLKILPQFIKKYNITQIYWNKTCDFFSLKNEVKLIEQLQSENVSVKICNGNYLTIASEIKNKQNTIYKIFTPYTKFLERTIQQPKILGIPKSFHQININPNEYESEEIKDWQLYTAKPDWASEFKKYWQPGENGAKLCWKNFLKNNILKYAKWRNYPALDITSHISPYLQFGEVSIRQIYNSLEPNDEIFKKELFWREFAYYILNHFPNTIEIPFQSKFKNFYWDKNKSYYSAWKQGLTGYPIIDAGMRQLYKTGWMHNRIRMLVGSFLTKNLLLPWQWGAKWFWVTLLDADLANNSMNWQWVAGTGVDAAPYFRIFNPITQSKLYDPKGEYIKRWVPELAELDPPHIHEPWRAPTDVLNQAGISLEKTYPLPIVDIHKTRAKALSLYSAIKSSTGNS